MASATVAQVPAHRLIEPGSAESARESALVMLRHLSAGEIEAAARLSNAPQRRLEVLRAFQQSVGAERFKALFARYFAPENRLVAEAGIERHRLLVWELGEAGGELTALYYVEVNGKFLLDDIPSKERSALQRVFETYRQRKSGSGS